MSFERLNAAIEERAAELVAQWYQAGYETHQLRDELTAALLAELEAERERCAKIAEAVDRAGREWVPNSLWDTMRRQTAADIRRDPK